MRGAVSSDAKFRRIGKLLFVSLLFMGYCTLFFAAVDAAQQKIGNWAVLVWGIAFLVSLVGPASLWFAWEAFRKLKPLSGGVFDPAALPEEGARIAVCGQAVAGDPLTSPLGGKLCGAYRYKGTWSRAYRRGNDNRTETVANASGYGIAELELQVEGGEPLRIAALPELEGCISEEDRGGPLSERLLEQYDCRRAEDPHAEIGNGKDAVDLGAHMDQANRHLRTPARYDYLGPRARDRSDLTTSEEHLPLGQTVTMIGRYDRLRHEMLGPLSAYLGTIDEVREKLSRTAAQLTRVGLIVTVIAAAMIILPLVM
jgi:hypothetical protein